jgi:hypothetical protein
MLEVVAKAVVVHGTTVESPSRPSLRPRSNRREPDAVLKATDVDLLCEMRRCEGKALFASPCRLPRACHLSVTAGGIAGLVIGAICPIPPRLSSACPSTRYRAQLAHDPGLAGRRR